MSILHAITLVCANPGTHRNAVAAVAAAAAGRPRWRHDRLTDGRIVGASLMEAAANCRERDGGTPCVEPRR